MLFGNCQLPFGMEFLDEFLLWGRHDYFRTR